MDRYVVGLCDEPELFSKADERGVRYYPRIYERGDYAHHYTAKAKAIALAKEKAMCDFSDGTPGRCVVLLEYPGGKHDKTWAFDKNGNKKRLQEPIRGGG